MSIGNTCLERWLITALDSPAERGGAVAIVDDGDASCAYAGLADGASGRAVRAGTAFPIACLAKPVLATLTLALIDAGRLALDDGIRTLLPASFDGLHRISRSIRLHHLLTHLSGLGGAMDFENRALSLADGIGSDDFVAIAEPGDVYSYSSFGFLVLVKVIEAVTDTDWREALDRHLGKPLRVGFQFGPSGTSAVGHAWDECTRVLVPQKPLDPQQADRLHETALDLHMTAANLARFASLHVSGGIAPCGRRLLRRHLCELMYSGSQRPRFGSTPISGLTWKHFAPGVYGHIGLTDGSRASLLLCRKNRKALICLANSGTSALSERLHAANAVPNLISEHALLSRRRRDAIDAGVTGRYVGADRFVSVQTLQYPSSPKITMCFHEPDGTPFADGCVPLLRVGPTDYYVGKPRCARLPKSMLVQFVADATGSIGWARVNGKALRKQPRAGP